MSRRRSAELYHYDRTEPSNTQDNTSGWSEIHENILKEWKAKCFVNLWLQDASAYYYSKVYNWLSFPVIIISSVSSAALFSSENQIAKYFIGGMAMVAGILTSISRQTKPGELYQQHMLITRRYHNLIRSIDTCLSLPNSMRTEPMIFIEKIGSEIDILMDTQLDAPHHVIQSFERIYGPIERLLYGQDIVELLKLEIQTSTLFQTMKKGSHMSSEELSDLNTPKETSNYMIIDVPNEK